MAFGYRNPLVFAPVGDIVSVRNLLDPRGVSGGWSVGAGRTYTRVLRVMTNSPYVGPRQIISAIGTYPGEHYRFPIPEYPSNSPGLPSAPTEEDRGSFVNSIRCEPEGEDMLSWLVTLEFAPYDVNHDKGDEKAADGSHDPTKERPKVSWTSAKYEYHRAFDKDDKPFLNTVGDPLLDPPPNEETRPILTITRNEERYSESYSKQFKDAVNSDTFLGYPPNTVKCKDILGERQYQADWGYYWEVKYEFEIRDDTDTVGDGWTTVLLNRGFRELKSGVKSQVLIDGMPVSDPVLLTEAGLYDPDPEADPHYLEFRLFEAVDFGDLNIPEDILTATI